MRSRPYVSGKETPVKRIRYFAFVILVCNAVLLAVYEPYMKPRLLDWASRHPDMVDSAYYTLVFGYLELPMVITILVAATIMGLATHLVRSVRSLARSDRWLPWLLVGVGAIQLAIALSLDTIPHSDSMFYLERAARLAETGTYTTSLGDPTAFWPVGYPAMLSAVRVIAGDAVLAYRIFHILIFILLVYVLFRTFRRSGGKQISLVAFTFLYALHPNGLLSVNAVLTEFPFMLLMWLGIFLLLGEQKPRWQIFVAGVCLGISALIKPLVLGLVFFLALYFVWKRKTKAEILRMAVFAGAFTIVILPWLVRNAVQFHAFVPVSTNGGMNFYIGNNPEATGKFDAVFFTMEPGLNEAQRSARAFRKGFEFIVEQPGRAVSILPRKLFYALWRGDASVTWSLKQTETPVQRFLPALLFYSANLVHYIMLFGLVILLWYWKWIFPNSISMGMFSVILLYFLIVVVVFFGSERFLAPVMPIPLWFLAQWLMGAYSKMDEFVAVQPGHLRKAGI